MSSSGKSRPTLRSARGTATAGATMCSVLRLAARDRLARAAAPGWLDGLRRALRAAGPTAHASPLHAMLCDFPASELRPGR
ncbi:MAG TPA: hypothetical protein VNV16_12325 [Methylibium sp.]|nr:hypothetical protein [Methylibium sp.]